MFLNFSKRRRKRQRQCYKTLSMSSPFDFTTVLFGQLWSYSVHSVHFDYLVYFGLIRSIFGLIHFTSVLFGHFGSIQSISVHSDHFHPIPSTSVFSHRTGTTYHFFHKLVYWSIAGGIFMQSPIQWCHTFWGIL